jgi:hypothetical protein
MTQILPHPFWWNDTFMMNAFHKTCPCLHCRKFGVKCSRCGDRLLPRAEVMRVQSHVFHLQCFVCVVCCQPLVKGAEFVLRGGQLFCKQEFEKELYMMQQASPSGTITIKYFISLISSLCVASSSVSISLQSVYSWWIFFSLNSSLSWLKS